MRCKYDMVKSESLRKIQKDVFLLRMSKRFLIDGITKTIDVMILNSFELFDGWEKSYFHLSTKLEKTTKVNIIILLLYGNQLKKR